MTENLVKLVARSGIYAYDRSDKIKRIAKNADSAACDIASTNGVLSIALEDAGISESAALPYQPLARRINEIRNQVMMHRKGNVPVVQVCSFIEALDEILCTVFEGGYYAHNYARQWERTAQSLTDARLVFFTVATWLAYIHAKTDTVRHKPIREDRALFFLYTTTGEPRLDYSEIRDAVGDAKRLAAHIGTDRFETNMKRRYFEFPM